MSRYPTTNIKGCHDEWGRSIEDLTGALSMEKFIQFRSNSTCDAIGVD
jgi:hypothetical protein